MKRKSQKKERKEEFVWLVWSNDQKAYLAETPENSMFSSSLVSGPLEASHYPSREKALAETCPTWGAFSGWSGGEPPSKVFQVHRYKLTTTMVPDPE